jgi:hypothetical protein
MQKSYSNVSYFSSYQDNKERHVTLALYDQCVNVSEFLSSYQRFHEHLIQLPPCSLSQNLQKFVYLFISILFFIV